MARHSAAIFSSVFVTNVQYFFPAKITDELIRLAISCCPDPSFHEISCDCGVCFPCIYAFCVLFSPRKLQDACMKVRKGVLVMNFSGCSRSCMRSHTEFVLQHHKEKEYPSS